jgi:dephospho-CoA kinase/inosine/xanthosine triphosphate pyrophosphatase family protein
MVEKLLMDEIVFITSNNIKLVHVRYIARGYDIFISKQKNYGIGYNEPIVRDRRELLEKSIKDARLRWKKNVSSSEEKFFFIEDTSVNIPCLAEKGEEFPGVNVKYWMKKNDFFSIDSDIKKAGNNRTAIVRSDVVLVLSKKIEEKLGKPYIIFTSEIKGRVSEDEYSIKTQPYYSWLDDKSFNKWFIPDSCELPLSALPIIQANNFDFRSEAVLRMFKFLESYNLVQKKKLKSQPSIQLGFFLPSIFIITGPTCAGKTTIAEYLSNNFNYYHLEASDFMNVRFLEHHGPNSQIDIADFAEKALKVDSGIVVDQINRNLKLHLGVPKVITGLRSPLEIDNFLRKYDNEFQVQIIYIEANFDQRYKRSLIRRRGGIKFSKEDFKLRDEQQSRMGLDKIAANFNENEIENNTTKTDYYNRFLKKFGDRIFDKNNDLSVEKTKVEIGLEEIIILSLARNNSTSYYTTTQISHLIAKFYPQNRKNKNNVSRYFNQNFYPYYKVNLYKGKKVFRLSQTGISKAKYLSRNYKSNE